MRVASRLTDRSGELLEDAATRGRLSARERTRRVTDAWRSILQSTIAASLAWLVATELLGHERPFFAPVAAIVTLGITLSERGQRAVELAIGVALGIAVADVLIVVLGIGAAQIALVVPLAMIAALLLGSGQLLATQAAVSAALVATIEAPSDGITFARALDGLLGGAFALLVNAVVLPADPRRLIRRAAEPVFAELAGTLDDLAGALAERDFARAERALLRARAIDPLEDDFADAVRTSRDNARLAPSRRRTRRKLSAYAEAEIQVDFAVRNVRVLARGILRALELESHVPPDIPAALRELGQAVRALGVALEQPGEIDHVEALALRAAARATLVLERTGNLSVSVIVGQIRSTAVDLLRGATGLTYEEATEAVRDACRVVDLEALEP